MHSNAMLTSLSKSTHVYNIYHPKTKFAKVVFLHVSVCPQWGGGIPARLAGLQAHTRGGERLRGLARGSPGPHPGRRLRGLAGGGRSPCPHPGGGEVEGSGQGGFSSPTPRGVCIPACIEADTPLPQQTATAAGGTHPTGMHSCFVLQVSG